MAGAQHHQCATLHYLDPLLRGTLGKGSMLSAGVEDDALRCQRQNAIMPGFLHHRIHIKRDGVKGFIQRDLVQYCETFDHPVVQTDRDHGMGVRQKLAHSAVGVPLRVRACAQHQGPSFGHGTKVVLRQQGLFTAVRDLTFPIHPHNMAGAALHSGTGIGPHQVGTMKRNVDILVLSDLHLGTYGCRAEELIDYLRSIKPAMVILNGDIIDIWQFKKSYFPSSHMKVLKRLLKLAAKVPVHYITGNHDEALRRYSPADLGKLHLCDRLELTVNGERYWFFHGDIFDASMKHAKWLAKLGGAGYDLLIRINTVVNWLLVRMGRPRMSFSKRVKQSVKRAVAYIGDFEETAATIAIHEGFQHVICGHIHQPQIRRISTEKGSVNYMNSGDWIEHMSALEFVDGKWSLYYHGGAVHAPIPLIRELEQDIQMEHALA